MNTPSRPGSGWGGIVLTFVADILLAGLLFVGIAVVRIGQEGFRSTLVSPGEFRDWLIVLTLWGVVMAAIAVWAVPAAFSQASDFVKVTFLGDHPKYQQLLAKVEPTLERSLGPEKTAEVMRAVGDRIASFKQEIPGLSGRDTLSVAVGGTWRAHERRPLPRFSCPGVRRADLPAAGRPCPRGRAARSPAAAPWRTACGCVRNRAARAARARRHFHGGHARVGGRDERPLG